MKWFVVGCFVVVCGMWRPVAAGEFVIVPKSLDEIINVNFRNALADQAAEYDDLDRRTQVRTFVQVYRSLNRGQDPALAPNESLLLAGPASAAPVVPVPAFQNPRSGDVYQYYGDYGYRRFPNVTANPPALGASTYGGPVSPWALPPAVTLSPRVSRLPGSVPGTVADPRPLPGAPAPYERPPVARPRRAESVHAGP